MRPILLTILLLAAAGCQSGAMTPGDLAAVRTTGLADDAAGPADAQLASATFAAEPAMADAAPRLGNAYLLRGWIGVFSTGINDLTGKLNANGVRAHVYQDDQWRALSRRLIGVYADAENPEPLVLIGHSYGADDVIRIARRLDEAGVAVDLLVTLDPVTPPAVPKNVRRAINLYQPNGVFDALPVLRGIPLSAEVGVELENWNLRKNRRDLLEAMGSKLDHFNIEKKAVVHDAVITEVLLTCPPAEPELATDAVPPTVPPTVPAPDVMLLDIGS